MTSARARVAYLAAVMMRHHGGDRRLEGSLTQLRLFVVASAVILVAGAALLGSALARTLRGEAVDLKQQSLAQYVDGVLGPVVVRGNKVVTTRWLSATISRVLRNQPDVVSVKVWRPDGVLAFTTLQRTRIGHRFPLDDELGEAIHENRAVAGIVGAGANGEDAAEARLGFTHLIQVYAPLENATHTRAIGAYEIYANAAPLESLIASRVHMIWFTVAAVFGLLWLALVLLVRRASRTLRRRTVQLRDRSTRLLESYRLLEQSALEAIETLNAAVDAKDPYTAGHSQRVRDVALAIGDALGLPRDRLGALKLAGLFHDIGKLRVPDAVLTKPGPLTRDEFELVKRHPEDGAEIVSHLGRLHDALPFIRHHHERWDGGGYPDGLAGAAIPLEASIVGLADAWDAMTTDRPYSRALTFEEAVKEIRNARGTQFSPSVVDAFLSTIPVREPDLVPAG
ncbi:MAG: HD-GYP domain-containing protein [Actinobacteria bacterium]|nr:HD-GYP domain-containing protein [Actinomycetota bacterium]